MNAFEALRVEKTASVADDKRAVCGVARHGIPTAVRQGFRTVANELAAFENLFAVRMRLPPLKSGVRIELRVGIFEREDEADGKAVVRKAVDPATAVHVG